MEEKHEPLVSIIILNYNAGNLLIECVNSVLKSNYENFEVIVVDNVSTDNSHKECKNKFENIKLIENNTNLGYCGGNNVGIKEANGEFIVLLNPDTTVESNWLSELIKTYKKHGEGIYQPKIMSMENHKMFLSSGNMIHLFGFGFPMGRGSIDENQFQQVKKIGYASGTCLFTSKKIFEKVGLLDSFLFLYHDDLDFGWRAAQLGINSFYNPNAKIFHAESYSLKWSANKFYWLERNRKYCLLTHFSKKTYSKIFPYLIFVELCVIFFYLSKGFIKAKIKADIDMWKCRKQINKKYHELEIKKIISDKRIISEFPDHILIPNNVYGRRSNEFLNKILGWLSRKAKKKILD